MSSVAEPIKDMVVIILGREFTLVKVREETLGYFPDAIAPNCSFSASSRIEYILLRAESVFAEAKKYLVLRSPLESQVFRLLSVKPRRVFFFFKHN